MDNNDGTKDTTQTEENDPSVSALPRKLEQAVTLKEQDLPSFASGLVAASTEDPLASDPNHRKELQISSYYANQNNNNEAQTVVLSERARRKQRQRELRLQLEAQERERALQQALDQLLLMQEESDQDLNAILEQKQNPPKDVHLTNFDLPNLRNGGSNLLDNANLTLATGRRYGYVHAFKKNGCFFQRLGWLVVDFGRVD